MSERDNNSEDDKFIYREDKADNFSLFNLSVCEFESNQAALNGLQ